MSFPPILRLRAPRLSAAALFVPLAVLRAQAPAPASPPAPDPAAAPASASAPAPAGAQPKRDDGRLDPAWFAPERLEFRQSGKLDYLWVRPGFSLQGRTVQFLPWEATVLLPERDEKDRRAAAFVYDNFPPKLAEVFGEELDGTARVVAADGEVRVLGRIVDCNAGNAWAYVYPQFTFELKFLDRDGVLQAALHTRYIGKALKLNLGPWAKWTAKPFSEGGGIEAVWKAGKPAEP